MEEEKDYRNSERVKKDGKPINNKKRKLRKKVPRKIDIQKETN